jgi:hypothetical protein
MLNTVITGWESGKSVKTQLLAYDYTECSGYDAANMPVTACEPSPAKCPYQVYAASNLFINVRFGL